MRRFEHGGSKFWEIETTGKELRLRFGKLGANGQLKLQTYATPGEAAAAAETQIARKRKEGYVERSAGKKPAKQAAAVADAPALPVRRGWESNGVKPTQVKLTPAKGPAKNIHRLAIIEWEGQPAVIATGASQAFGSTDGKTFHRRPETPGLSYGLFAIDNILYSMGGPLAISTDAGQHWKTLKKPVDGYIFTLMRDSNHTYWLGADRGAVFTAQKPGTWTKAKFAAPGKVMDVAEIDGKIFVVGAGSGVWNGKKFSKFANVKETITRITEGPDGGLVMVGDGGVAYRSADRGKTWKKSTTGVKNDIEDLAWVAGSLFAVGGAQWGSGGFVLRSDDEGKSWKAVGKTDAKLWSIESWGDGAICAGEAGVYILAAPNDSFWTGKKDTFEPPPLVADELFTPNQARSDKDRAAKFDKLYAQAIADHQRISAKQRAARPADANPKLAKAVDDGADGAEEIYADWLSDAGDPRGELAQIQLRLANDPKNKDLKKAEKELLKQHQDAFLGKLAGLGDVAELEWKAGFITKARIANSYHRSRDFGNEDEPESKPEVDIEQLVEELVTMPSGRFLRELTVGIVEFTDNDYGGVAAKLGKHYLPALRSLFLGDFAVEDTELNWSALGKLEPMYAALPNLERLKLRSGSMNLGTIVLPNLKSFEVITGGMDAKSLKSIANAVWPALESLSIQTGPEPSGGEPKPADLKPILDGDSLPHLTHLRLDNMNFTHALVKPLAMSKILPQLSELGLAMGTLGDENIAEMFALQKAFKHLNSIDVTDNFLTAESKKLFKQANLKVQFGEQRDDDGGPEDRYASAYE